MNTTTDRTAAAPRSPWRVLHSYIFWSYERGSLHFDIMVTLILLFIFVSPRFIDFHDKPVRTVPLHRSEVLVKQAGFVAGKQQFLYEVRAEDLGNPQTPAALQEAALGSVQAVAGDAVVEKISPVLDAKGRTIAYEVLAHR